MSRRRSAPLKVTPVQVVTAGAVLGLFVAAVAIGGWIGALMLGVVALAAGGLLALRWRQLDPKIRTVRLVAVLAALAVAITLAVRG
jgi:hypothetical protein